MNIQLVTWTPLERECALVIFTNVACPKITTDDESTLPLFKVVSQIAGTESHQRLFEGKLGQALCYRENAQIGGRVLIFIGLTKVGLAESERFRRGAAYAFSALQNEKVIKAAIYLAEDSSGNFCQPIAEGLTLSSYQMAEFKRAAAASNVVIKEISIVSPESDIKNGEIRTGKIVADATNFARRIGDLPPNLLTPTTFCKLTQNEIGNLPVQYEEWNPERLAAEKMEGLLNVSKGSAEEARMLILRYEGTTKENNPLCLVGKGITFDSGGLDLKSAKNMESMRFDMCGAAAVVAATIAIAKLKLPVNIVAFAALAENMPGPKAMRPGDIYFTRNGTSVEIMNTDAEGRLVLADALCLATEEKPRAIIDVATLTGAIVAALGNLHSGLFTRSPELLQALESASELTGEKIWRLPLTEDHEDDVKGQTADITNQCTYTGAGSATAAAFLAQFVPQSIPWAHLDIAGTAQDVGQRLPYSPKNGASGVMVRTLVQIAESHLCKAATVRCVS